MNPYIQYMYSYPHKTAYGPLSGISLEDYTPFLAGEGHGLYLHIPFCQSKCGYCNLFSVTGQDTGRMDRYLHAVERQCRQYKELLEVHKTVFSELVIGGGTPLLLTESQLSGIFEILETYFVFREDREAVIETAPNQTSREKLEILRQAHITRISMGVQSFSDQELKILRRQHSAKSAREAMSLLKEYHFPCINMDFIYGIPGQTVETLLASLREALTFEPDEIFLYPLYIKHGASLQGISKEGFGPCTEDAGFQYREACGYLRAEGYRQDSMRRFVKSRKARGYSECGLGTSLALGCGGRSYLGNLHFCSPYAITRTDCLTQLDTFEHTEDYRIVTHGILLTEEEMRRRYVIRHLLIRPGLLCRQYQKHFGSCAEEDYPILEKWKTMGYLCQKGDFLTLTERGMELSDYLGPQLISEEIREKMREWDRSHGETGTFISGQPKEL